MLPSTAIKLASLPVVSSLQPTQGLPTLANAVEGLFSLAPSVLQSPVLDAGAVKLEARPSAGLKRRSSGGSAVLEVCTCTCRRNVKVLPP